MTDHTTPVSFNNRKSPFFRALREKVDNYFTENNIRKSGNTQLYFKSILFILTAVVLYTTLVFFTPGTWLAVVLCVLFGLNLSLIGFNIMHEGVHQSFSRHKFVNRASAYFLNILGGSTYFWKIKHGLNHHTYTNIQGMDSDIELEPFMRLHDEQRRRGFHRFQHLYWIFLYGLSYLSWIFYDDFHKYFSGRIAAGTAGRLNVKESLIFWATKLFYIAAYLLLPALMIGLLKVLIGYFIITFVCGLSIAVVFQLAHVVEATQFPQPAADNNKIDSEWAVHQVNTTANFGTKSRVLSWLLGGLNFQVEHHLFPKISHIHYPRINQIVKETCLQFNVSYIEYPTALKAFHSHLLHIRRLGRR